MSHKDNQHVVVLCEVLQLIEHVANIACFVLPALFIFKPVVRVDDKPLYAFLPYKKFCFFEDGVELIVRRADKRKVLFEVCFHFLVFGDR